MRVPSLIALATGLAVAGAAAAEPLPVVHRLPPPGGIAQFLLPGEGVSPVPLVVFLPDAGGEQGRAEVYAEALWSHGVASLVLGVEEDAAPASGEEALRAALAWVAAQTGVLEPGQVVVAGFGAGARAAIAAAEGAVVAIDPGCIGLAVPAHRRVLVLHGTAAEDSAACETLGGAGLVTVRSLFGAEHGWDLLPAAAPGSALLPHPDGQGRWRARPDPAATEAAAEITADWILDALWCQRQ